MEARGEDLGFDGFPGICELFKGGNDTGHSVSVASLGKSYVYFDILEALRGRRWGGRSLSPELQHFQL